MYVFHKKHVARFYFILILKNFYFSKGKFNVYTYDNYEDAKQDFESLKTKIKGLVRHANGYIDTWI